MESTLFDDLIRRLSEQVTRRRSLGLLGVLGATGLSGTDEALARKKKKKKRKGKGKGKGAKATTPQPSSTTTATPDICTAGIGAWCNAEKTCACSVGVLITDPLRCLEFENVETATACDDDADCPSGQACGEPSGAPGSTFCGVLCLG